MWPSELVSSVSASCPKDDVLYIPSQPLSLLQPFLFYNVPWALEGMILLSHLGQVILPWLTLITLSSSEFLHWALMLQGENPLRGEYSTNLWYQLRPWNSSSSFSIFRYMCLWGTFFFKASQCLCYHCSVLKGFFFLSPVPMSWRLFSTLSFRTFILSGLMLKSLRHFLLEFYTGW